MIYAEAGKRIQSLRESQHLSREKLAEMINMSARFICDIEHGRKGFSAKTLWLLSSVFDVSCDYILFGKEKKNCNIAG